MQQFNPTKPKPPSSPSKNKQRSPTSSKTTSRSIRASAVSRSLRRCQDPSRPWAVKKAPLLPRFLADNFLWTATMNDNKSRQLQKKLMVVFTCFNHFSCRVSSQTVDWSKVMGGIEFNSAGFFCHTGDWHQINNVDNISSTLLHKNPHLINQQYYLSLNVRMLRKETQITLRLIFSPNPWTTRDVWKPSESQSNTRPSLVFHHQYFAKYFTHLYNNCACSEAWIRGWSGHGPVNGSSHALRQLEFGHGGKDVTCDVQPRRVHFTKNCRDLSFGDRL